MKLAFAALCSLALLSACSKDNGSSSPSAAPAAPGPTGPQSEKQTTPPAVPDSGAKEAFKLTYAAGDRVFAVKSMSAHYVRTENGAKTAWDSECRFDRPISLRGEYPGVELRLPRLDCGPQHAERELTQLSMMTSAMSYHASFIPAIPDEPHQFRLSLESQGDRFTRWKRQESLNALLKDRVAFFDFVGTEQGELGNDDVNRDLSVTFKQELGGRETLFIQYDVNELLDQARATVMVEAELVRQ
jgi:hypothetical protein